MHITTKALVLRGVDYKESDRILTLLTQEQGKLTASARGCRKKGSAIAAGCQLLAWSELVLYDYQGRWAVKEAAVERLFQGVRNDIVRLSLGCYFAEAAELLAVEGEENTPLLSLTLNSLHALDKMPEKPLALVKAAFEWKAMALAGYEPRMEGCAVCGTAPPEEPRFHLREGCFTVPGAGRQWGMAFLCLCPPRRWPPLLTSSTATPDGCSPSSWRESRLPSWPTPQRRTSTPSWSGGFLHWIIIRACSFPESLEVLG